MRDLVGVFVVCLAVAGCSEGSSSLSSTAPPASSSATSSTVSPASTVSTTTTDPAAATTTTGMVSPGCTETLPELPGPGESLIFAVCDFDTSLPYPLVRDAVPGLGSVESALSLLVRGTTAAEQEDGLMVGFDWVEPSDADRIRVEVGIDAAGVVDLEFVLDGEPWHPGTLAGTSFQAFSFVDPLYATVFQFPEVTGIGPGSLCWGELDCTQVFSRGMWESMVSANARRDVGPGCGMLGAWFDPACGASLPSCADGLEIVSGAEGATGSAVYYLEITAPEACFMDTGRDGDRLLCRWGCCPGRWFASHRRPGRPGHRPVHGIRRIDAYVGDAELVRRGRNRPDRCERHPVRLPRRRPL